MTFEEFKISFKENNPPAELSEILTALWWEKKGNWEAAHQLAQTEKTWQHNLVHAYLHRVEGDNWNADYWYKKAKKEMPSVPLSEEWEAMVKDFLGL